MMSGEINTDPFTIQDEKHDDGFVCTPVEANHLRMKVLVECHSILPQSDNMSATGAAVYPTAARYALPLPLKTRHPTVGQTRAYIPSSRRRVEHNPRAGSWRVEFIVWLTPTHSRASWSRSTPSSQYPATNLSHHVTPISP